MLPEVCKLPADSPRTVHLDCPDVERRLGKHNACASRDGLRVVSGPQRCDCGPAASRVSRDTVSHTHTQTRDLHTLTVVGLG